MIEGKRVHLRAVERGDLPKFQEWLNDPEVTEGLASDLPLSVEDEERWFSSIHSDPHEERPLSIEIRTDDGWKLAGNTRFFHLKWVHRNAEFGIVIGDKALWDQGYGTEVLQLMLEHAFEALNLHRIFLRVFAGNLRARRSYEKAGFKDEGTLRQAIFRRGRYMDVLMMSILQPEWKERREGK